MYRPGLEGQNIYCGRWSLVGFIIIIIGMISGTLVSKTRTLRMICMVQYIRLQLKTALFMVQYYEKRTRM
jgi:hypothetical protein